MIPFFLLPGCGDLEPEMQDTGSVVLKMNFNQRSSSRSSQISQAEVSSHKTHLILALPSWENLSSNYKNYYSSFAQELMNPSDNKVSLEIPLNTQMKIFAFLFREDYTKPQLLSGVREVGYYGESQPFSIGTNTNNLSLGITLQSTDTTTGDGDDNTDPDTDTETETDDTTVPDNTPPTVATVSTTADNQSSISITDNITVTFSESMDSTSVTTNTDNTSCYGTLGLSSDNFSSCVRMSSEPASSNSNMTFTLDPYDNLTVGTTYKTRVTTGVKDTAGNSMSSQYETSSGFTPADTTATTTMDFVGTTEGQIVSDDATGFRMATMGGASGTFKAHDGKSLGDPGNWGMEGTSNAKLVVSHSSWLSFNSGWTGAGDTTYHRFYFTQPNSSTSRDVDVTFDVIATTNGAITLYGFRDGALVQTVNASTVNTNVNGYMEYVGNISLSNVDEIRFDSTIYIGFDHFVFVDAATQ